MKLKDIRVTCRDYPGITFTIHTLSNDVAFIHPVNEYWGTWVDVNTLELVTPVKELEPYYVEKGNASYRLKKGECLLANYWPQHPHAKAAAVAERDRLNAENRKEQK